MGLTPLRRMDCSALIQFPFSRYRCSGQTLTASVCSYTRAYRGQLHGIWRCGVRLCMRSALRVFVKAGAARVQTLLGQGVLAVDVEAAGEAGSSRFRLSATNANRVVA